MARRKGSPGSVSLELVAKAREAALCATKIFNDPLVTFKSEAFIVLMMIAWTYLHHAYFRKKGIDFRYRKEGSRKLDKTRHGAVKHWELERCLNDPACPLDGDSSRNLRFLIGLRHEIEHQMTRSLDNFLSGRYQASILNFNHYVKELFGARSGIDTHLTYSLQFVELAEGQVRRHEDENPLPTNLVSFVTEFDKALSHEEYNSPRFSYRLFFKKKLVNRPGQADRVIEFIDPNSDAAKAIDREFWVKKEVERPKFRPADVVRKVKEAGFLGFRVQPEHRDFWEKEGAKDPAKGYGVEVAGQWYWYESWVERCIAHCRDAGDRYEQPVPKRGKKA